MFLKIIQDAINKIGNKGELTKLGQARNNFLKLIKDIELALKKAKEPEHIDLIKIKVLGKDLIFGDSNRKLCRFAFFNKYNTGKQYGINETHALDLIDDEKKKILKVVDDVLNNNQYGIKLNSINTDLSYQIEITVYVDL